MQPTPKPVLSDWHRQMAASIAAAHPITPAAPIRATGNHRVAQNDEPEPGDLTEADLAEIDRQFNIGRADRADRRALELQVQANLTDPLLRGCY